MRNVSQEKIDSVLLPLPPLAEQADIVATVSEKLSQIESAEVAIDHSLRRAARLRQSILKQAFEGKLVPQDPTDEPASSLLERIKNDVKLKTSAVARTRTRGRSASERSPEEET
jgi:type I restriction enzyme S subunit